MKSLSPFIDSKGILRVGGRLGNSDFSYDKKHPIILPYGSKLTNWIIHEAHAKTLHGGNQLTLAQIRHEFWIVGAKKAVKTFINRCVICHRFRARATEQLMGNLPGVRTKIVPKAFTHTGTDLCGPILMKMSSGRGQKTQKGYIVIFICLSTRAIHIEIVSDQSSEAFIAAFKRFIGRRGNVKLLYSDNGSNFVGASKILQLESEQAIKDFNLEIKNELAQFNTKFIFNPPSAPWFGGIWERNIGSIKYHLKRTVGVKTLTYEELSTVVIQIEACVNSRPMCPLSENINDLETLTPGHFLVGSALTAPLESNLIEVKENRLNRWELCSRIKQEFWNRWSSDYLALLQKKVKWTQSKVNLKEGDMVLLMDEQNAPLRWPIARITKTYPGPDGLVRVVDIYTKGKTYRRPVGKLSLMPIETDSESIENENTQKSVKKNDSNALTPENEKKSPKKSIELSGKKLPKSKSSKIISPIKSFTAIIITMLALVNSIYATTQKYSVEFFPKNASVYTENCGETAFATSNWNLIIHYSLENYFDEIEEINKMVEQTETLCGDITKKTRHESSCESILNYIDTKINSLNYNHEMIKLEINTRKKRSALAIGIISTIAGILGTKIVDWTMDNDENNDLAQKEISVLELIDENLRNVSHLTDTVKNDIYYTSILLHRLENLEKKQEKIAKLITEKHTKVTIDLITVKDLLAHIKTMATKMNINQLHGKNIMEKTLNIYKLVENPKIITLPQAILIALEIPLIENTFECHKMYPLKFTNNEKFFELEIPKNHIFINYTMGYYALMAETEMNQCVKIESRFVCKTQKLHKLTAARNTCEYNILENTYEGCLAQQTVSATNWIKLQHSNEWLFSAANEIEVKINCKNSSETIAIADSGKISCDERCWIESETEKINNNRDVTSNVEIEQNKWQVINFAPGKKDEIETNDIHNKILELKLNHEHQNFKHNAFIGCIICFNLILLIIIYKKHHTEVITVFPKIVN